MFSGLAGMFGQQNIGGWDSAKQMAAALASGNESEKNVDPADRIAYEQLCRVAEMHVTQLTGLTISENGILVRPATRHEWATTTIDAYKPLLERLSNALSSTLPSDDDLPDIPEAGGDPAAQMMAGLAKMLGPMLLSMTAGSMVGHLGQGSLGDYDLPIPRPDATELLAIHANVVAFTDEWSVPVDDVRLWVCLTQLTHHAVLRLPHVNERLNHLFNEYTGGFRPDPRAIEERFGSIDITDPSSLESMQSAMGDPEAILGVVQSDAQRELMPELQAIIAAVEGYCDWVLDTIGGKLIGSYGMLSEALRRKRIASNPSDRFIEQMLGLELDRTCYERGQSFIAGIIERSGEDGLQRLWRSARELPTPNEVDAPGLWLARIDIPDGELPGADDDQPPAETDDQAD